MEAAHQALTICVFGTRLVDTRAKPSDLVYPEGETIGQGVFSLLKRSTGQDDG